MFAANGGGGGERESVYVRNTPKFHKLGAIAVLGTCSIAIYV